MNTSYYSTPFRSDELYHHGIMNQKWGVRNGPPYPLSGGQYSPDERRAIYRHRLKGNRIYNKKHFDEVLDTSKTLRTLSYDPNRTKNADMFYATHDKFDKHQYNALFNKPVPQDLYDVNGNKVGTAKCFKYAIDNGLKYDLKMASEDSGAKIFANLYSKDRDFYNFVTDETRMQSYFDKSKYKFRGYRESKAVLDRMKKNESYTPSEKDMKKIYRMFNYTIPYDGHGDSRKGHDAALQRAKFFKECKNNGYGAVLDTNDAIYGSFKAKSPAIVFDMGAVVPKSVMRTTASSKKVSAMALAYRKAHGL